MDIVKFTHERLDAMRARPRMYASTRESFGMQILLLAEIALLTDYKPDRSGLSPASKLMHEMFGPGNVVPDKELDDTWASERVDITKKFLQARGL